VDTPIKRIVLSVAVVGVLVLGFCSRRKLKDSLLTIYRDVTSTEPESVAEKAPEPAKPPESRRLHAKSDGSGRKRVRPGVTPLESLPDPRSGVAGREPVQPVVAPPDSSSAPQTPDQTAYAMMIVGTESSYAELKDLGIFRNESVYTVYIAMEISGTPAPAWILQYAPLREDAPSLPSTSSGRRRFNAVQSVQMEAPVQAPVPLEKVYPRFPPDTVARNPGEMILVHSIITAEGKMEQARILTSPASILNRLVLDTLRGWTFRPAKIKGEPVAVKSLLRIVLPDTL
jgi:TonB-like protein